MVLVIVLALTLLTIGFVYWSGASRALLYVYLPCLLLVPLYMFYPVGGLAIDPSAPVVTILAIVGLATQFRSLRPTILDVLVIVYLASAYLADAQYPTRSLVALDVAAQTLFATIFPYILGRTLLQQTNLRDRLVQLFVVLLCVLAVLSLWEFRMTANPFQETVETLMHASTGWIRQMRAGFGRVAGPYGHAITAGMIFSVGIILQLWLLRPTGWSGSPRWSLIQRTSRAVIISLALLAGLVMTQSRGPWLGCGFGLMIACIGFFRNRKRAAFAVLALFIVSLGITSVVLNKYTDPNEAAHSSDVAQQDAVYRRQLWETYTPIVKEGGWLGHGTPSRDAYGNYSYGSSQASIDNNYLLLAVSQGYLGIAAFLLILIAGCARLIYDCGTFQATQDITFAYCLLGIVVASAFTLTTVFLNQPMTQILFLILGWSQSLRSVAGSTNSPPVRRESPHYEFERVFV